MSPIQAHPHSRSRVPGLIDDKVLSANILPQYSHVRAWFDASLLDGLHADGDSITVWPDSSGNSDLSGGATYNTNKINGKSAVYFDGGHSMITGANLGISGAGQRSEFIVYEQIDGGNRNVMGHGLNNTGQAFDTIDYFTSGNTFIHFVGYDSNSIGKAITANTWSAWFAGYGSGTIYLRRSGLTESSGSVGISTLDSPLTVGAGIYSSISAFYGFIAEVLVYDVLLSGDDLTAVSTYLNAKYGLDLGY